MFLGKSESTKAMNKLLKQNTDISKNDTNYSYNL